MDDELREEGILAGCRRAQFVLLLLLRTARLILHHRM